MKDWDWTVPMKCEYCGKDIYSVPEAWGYKRLIRKRKYADTSLVVFCSWRCMRAYEKEMESKKT